MWKWGKSECTQVMPRAMKANTLLTSAMMPMTAKTSATTIVIVRGTPLISYSVILPFSLCVLPLYLLVALVVTVTIMVTVM
jgi:hypothetical protein